MEDNDEQWCQHQKITRGLKQFRDDVEKLNMIVIEI